VSIAVVEGGRIAWARGFGVKEAGGRDSVTDATLFQAASISKPVAATTTLRLVERGTLDLDADVNRYLASWKVPENRFTAREPVTLRRILSHSAGLTVHGFPGYRAGDPLPTVAQVLDGIEPANTAAVRVDTLPGAVGRYSGGGTTVQQLLLTEVTGRPFPELMRDLVLAPAGMTRSTYEQPLPPPREGEAAHAHDRDGRPIPGRWHAYPEMAAAGLWTTPSDLLRWALAIDAARRGEPGAILSPAMAAQMLTEQKGGFGLGPRVQGSGPAFRFGHGGSNAGFRAQVVFFPETGQGAAVMTNGAGGGALIEEVLRTLAAEHRWPALAPERVTPVSLDEAALQGLVGEYSVHFGGPQEVRARIRRESGRLFLEAPPAIAREELVPVSPDRWISVDSGVRVVAERDASGRAAAFTLSNGDLTARATRVP
jgi:CubicO group peptidase (beta-lactamase class C family)